MAHHRDSKIILPINSYPGGLKTTMQQAIEVKVWEIYLVRNRTNVRDILATYSLDKGPKPADAKDPERVSIRFMHYDWDRSAEAILDPINHGTAEDKLCLKEFALMVLIFLRSRAE